MLEEDEESRRDGTGSEERFQDVAEQLRRLAIPFFTPFRANGQKPSFGLLDREISKLREDTGEVLRAAKEALTRGEVSFVSEQVSELLATFRVNLDPSSRAYRQLGLVVLKRYVRALQAISQRNQGEVVDTPRAVEPTHCEPATGGTISAARAGWRRQKQTTAMTLREFEHAVQRCKELHGDLPLEALGRHHVREFREALQAIPGKLSVSQRMSVSA